MEKYVTAAGLYLVGIFVYFIRNLFRYGSIKNAVEEVRKMVLEESDIELPWPDGVIAITLGIMVLLSAFIWPFSMIFDIKEEFGKKKENET